MSVKDIARILNNESNLRILDRLKERPYYPRELAMDMDLSEPFIVRRLKAMEEYGIVEGKWETVGNRKVKRYYIKDVKIEYGKEGLKVTSGEVQVNKGINIKNDLIGRLIKLPLVLIFLYGILFEITIILIAVLGLFIWQTAITLSFYREFKFKTSMLSIMVYIIGSAITLLMVMSIYKILDISPATVQVITTVMLAIVLFIDMYLVRYYQVEYEDMVSKTGSFIKDLELAPPQVKLFYLPMVIKWKISEYFKLI